MPVQSKSVLIVDDSAFARRKSREALEKLGYAVAEAASGYEALEKGAELKPAVVLLDLVMAGMGGAETLVRLRELLPDVRVIIATADTQESTAALVRAHGAIAVLKKPLTLAQLAPALASAFTPSERQTGDALKDRLAGVINTGYARAAEALSQMTGEPITLAAPSITICPAQEIAAHLASEFGRDVACVNQTFSGPVSGNAMLLIDSDAARTLAGLLENAGAADTLDDRTREMIAEVGNVMLSACIGVFGNLLRVQIGFAVPRLRIDTAGAILQSMSAEQEKLQHTVLVKTQFTVHSKHVHGYFVVLLGVASLNRLRLALETLAPSA